MTKKILAAVIAVMMVAALTVSAFANVDITADATAAINGDNTAYVVALPEGLDVSDGATVTLHIKGVSGNAAIRVYLTDASDNARVTDVALNTIEVVDGAFEATTDLVINYNGGWGGTAAPTHLVIKAEAYGVAFIDTTLEVVEFVTADAPAAEPVAEPEAPAAEPEAEPEVPAAEPEAPVAEPAPAPAEPSAPNTGLALAVVPAVVALAAVAVSKKH